MRRPPPRERRSQTPRTRPPPARTQSPAPHPSPAPRPSLVRLRPRLTRRALQPAEIFAVGEDVVRAWLHRYEREGPAGLEDRPRPGRPPVDRLARRIVDAQASNALGNSGLVQGFWTAALLAAFLAARFRLA